MEKRECNVCGKTKKSTEFYTNGKQPNGKIKYKPHCKECHNEINRRNFYANLIEYYGGAKNLKCSECGYDEYWCALDFHHKNGSEKDTNVSEMRGRSKKNLFKELDKCVILCANCHRKNHAGQWTQKIQNEFRG